MYDGSGTFAVEVGIPTKSGVGGGPDDPTAALVDNLSADFLGVGTLWILK